MQVDLADDEVKAIVDGLRTLERHSRRGFGDWLAKNTDKMMTPEWSEKVMRAGKAFDALVALRKKFGDVSPVKLDKVP